MRSSRIDSLFGSERSRGVPALAPLVDIVFLLIIFFVLVSQIVRARPEAVDLPAVVAEAFRTDAADEVLMLTVLGDGDGVAFSLAGDRFRDTDDGLAALADAIRRAREADPLRPIVLRAAARQPYADVRAALTALQRAGVEGVGVAFEPRRGQ